MLRRQFGAHYGMTSNICFCLQITCFHTTLLIANVVGELGNWKQHWRSSEFAWLYSSCKLIAQAKLWFQRVWLAASCDIPRQQSWRAGHWLFIWQLQFFLKQHISYSFVCQYDTRVGRSLKTAPFIILASAFFLGLFSNITFAAMQQCVFQQVVKELCFQSSRNNHIKVYNDDEAAWGEEVLLSPDVISDSNLFILNMRPRSNKTQRIKQESGVVVWRLEQRCSSRGFTMRQCVLPCQGIMSLKFKKQSHRGLQWWCSRRGGRGPA